MKRILTLILLTILISINGWVSASAAIVDWKLLTANAQFGENSYSAVTVQAGVIYSVGGLQNRNDVWSSSNGTTWTNVTRTAQINVYRGHLVSLNNVL